MAKVHILLVLVLLPILCDGFFFGTFCKIGFLRRLFNIFFNFCEEDTPSPTARPTPSPRSYLLDDFKGLSNAYSMNKGNIYVDWDEVFVAELEGVTFDVFVALGLYNFSTVLETKSVQDRKSVV